MQLCLNLFLFQNLEYQLSVILKFHLGSLEQRKTKNKLTLGFTALKLQTRIHRIQLALNKQANSYLNSWILIRRGFHSKFYKFFVITNSITIILKRRNIIWIYLNYITTITVVIIGNREQENNAMLQDLSVLHLYEFYSKNNSSKISAVFPWQSEAALFSTRRYCSTIYI